MIPPCAHPFRAGCISLNCRYARQVQKNACMIRGYSSRAASHGFGPSVAETMRGKQKCDRFFLSASLLIMLPPSVPRYVVPRERIIVEAPGYPSAEDERCRRHGRLTAGLCGHGRALLFAGCHIKKWKDSGSQSSPSSSGAIKRVGGGA